VKKITGPTTAEYGFTTCCPERLSLNPPMVDFLPTRLGLKISNPHGLELLDGLTPAASLLPAPVGFTDTGAWQNDGGLLRSGVIDVREL